MACMNYISEINGFERWLETHQLPMTAQLLWYKLIYWSSRAGWPEWTQVDNRRLMVSLQITREASLAENRERLVNAGLIAYQKGKKGSPGRYRIISFEGNTTKCTYNLNVQNVVYPEVYSEVYSEVQTVAINKEKEKKKLKKSISKDIPEKYAQNPELDAAVREFIAYRKSRKKPMTDRAVTMLLDKLEALAPGDDAQKIAILEQSVFNSWTGVFALKKDQDGKETEDKSRTLANNRFHNFPQSTTSYDDLMKKKLKERMMEEGSG